MNRKSGNKRPSLLSWYGPSAKSRKMANDGGDTFRYMKEAVNQLENVIKNMAEPISRNPHPYRVFGDRLMDNDRIEVIEHLIRFLVSIVNDPTKIDDISSNGDNENLIALLFVNIAHEWPWIFANQLKHEKMDKRYRMVILLFKLFRIENSGLIVARHLITDECACIWNEFLNRFADKEIEIRKLCIEIATELMISHNYFKIVNDMRETLSNRMTDVNMNVREKSVNQIELISEKRIDSIIANELMKQFIMRSGDTNHVLRRTVIVKIGRVFRTINHKYGHITPPLFFYKLPSVVLLRYANKKCLPIDRFFMMKTFAEYFVGIDEDSYDKMRNLLNLMCFCDESTVMSIIEIFRHQKSLRRVITSLVARIGHDKDYPQYWNETTEEQRNHLKKILFSNRMVLPQIEHKKRRNEVIEDFEKRLKDNPNERNLMLMLLQSKALIDSKFAKSKTRELFQLIKCESRFGHDDYGRFIQQLIVQMGIGFIDLSDILILLRQIRNYPLKYSQRITILIVIISRAYSALFNDKQSIHNQLLSLPIEILRILSKDSVISSFYCNELIKEEIKKKAEVNDDNADDDGYDVDNNDDKDDDRESYGENKETEQNENNYTDDHERLFDDDFDEKENGDNGVENDDLLWYSALSL